MRKLKITKEQYDRLFSKGLLKESDDTKDKPSYGTTDPIEKETKELLKYLYRESSEISPFWEQHGLTKEEICDALVGKKLIVKRGDKYNVPKDSLSKEDALNAIEAELRILAKMPEKEVEPEPVDEVEEVEPIINQTDYEVFVYNDEVIILKDIRENNFFLLDLNHENIINYEGDELSIDDVTEFLNEKKAELPSMLIPLDLDLLNELGEMYNLNNYFTQKIEEIKNILGGLNEEKSDFASHYSQLQPKQRTFDASKAIMDKVRSLKAQSDIKHPKPVTKHPLDPHPEDVNDKNNPNQTSLDLEETSAAGGSAGAFTPALSMEPIKREIAPVVSETTVAGAGNFQYDTPGLANIGRNGEFKTPKKKAKAEVTPQWAGGAFVEQPDCSKPNNNKEAQNGGCNSGASSLKMKKASGSVNAPTLAEGLMREALKLQHDKNQNKLIVISDLEGRAASQETFRNKAVLKQNGFNWNGTNWVIDANKLEIAKKTLSLVNKSEYVIDQLEDLEDAVENSTADNKDLLKAKIDQYIMDLANATDEVALSAEIRRYLTFFSKFHGYSFYNRMLIFIQKPNATKVGSYKLWESKFRRPNPGTAIKVLAPAGKPEMTQYDDETTELMGQLGMTNKPQITRFRAVNVFDISDTVAIDERGDVPDSPQWWGENTPSETADILFGAVSEVAVDLGIRVTQSDAQGGEKGYSAGDHINISSDVSGSGRLSTTIHEIGHELMHWKKSSIYYIDNGQGKESYALGELQAESVSYVVLKHYGIPVAHHATYLALWKANKEKIQKNLEIISKVSQFIIDKIDKQVSNTEKQ